MRRGAGPGAPTWKEEELTLNAHTDLAQSAAELLTAGLGHKVPREDQELAALCALGTAVLAIYQLLAES